LPGGTTIDVSAVTTNGRPPENSIDCGSGRTACARAAGGGDTGGGATTAVVFAHELNASAATIAVVVRRITSECRVRLEPDLHGYREFDSLDGGTIPFNRM
jgi:hypothetical protein